MSSDSGSTVVDSPLSITASVAGILTFVVALAAAAFVRIRYLSNADEEFYRIKGSLQWYKTESEFIGDLLNGAGQEKRREEKQYQMCAYVVDQLGKLEESLLSLLTEVEVEAGRRAEGKREEEGMGRGSGWTFVPEKVSILPVPFLSNSGVFEVLWSHWLAPACTPDMSQSHVRTQNKLKGVVADTKNLQWRGNTVVAVTWVSVRKEALELVRQREALGSRVLFAQLSMLST